MKRLAIILALVTGISVTASAQPKAVGVRIGATGLDASYQHDLNRNTFLQGDLGMDFGSSIDAAIGVKATALYNYIWARPAWTDHGSWALFAGGGVTLGGVADKVRYKDGSLKFSVKDHGFLLALTAQAGIEYNFEFPLQLSLDIRPYIGLHVNKGYTAMGLTGTEITYGGKTGFYDRGMWGFIPTLAARYCF